MPALSQAQWPSECQRPECKGVFVGGCVAHGDGSRFRAKAHAHTKGQFAGWLCFLSERRLAAQELVLHEMGHLIAGCGHTDKWRAAVLAIGGTLDAVIDPSSKGGLLLKSYHKKHRR